MAKEPVMSVALTEDELRFLIWATRFMEGGVDKEADKKRLYLETLFEKALDFREGKRDITDIDRL